MEFQPNTHTGSMKVAQSRLLGTMQVNRRVNAIAFCKKRSQNLFGHNPRSIKAVLSAVLLRLCMHDSQNCHGLVQYGNTLAVVWVIKLFNYPSNQQ